MCWRHEGSIAAGINNRRDVRVTYTEPQVLVLPMSIKFSSGENRLELSRGDGALRVDCTWVLDASTSEWFNSSALYAEWDYFEALTAAAAGAIGRVDALSGERLELSRVAPRSTGFEMFSRGEGGTRLYLRLPLSLADLAFDIPGPRMK